MNINEFIFQLMNEKDKIERTFKKNCSRFDFECFEEAFSRACVEVYKCYKKEIANEEPHLKAIFRLNLKRKYQTAVKQKIRSKMIRQKNVVCIEEKTSLTSNENRDEILFLSRFSNNHFTLFVITNPFIYYVNSNILDKRFLEKVKKKATITSANIYIKEDVLYQAIGLYSVIKNYNSYGENETKYDKEYRGFLARDNHFNIEKNIRQLSPSIRIEKSQRDTFSQEIYDDYHRSVIQRVETLEKIDLYISKYAPLIQRYFAKFLEEEKETKIDPSQIDASACVLAFLDQITIFFRAIDFQRLFEEIISEISIVFTQALNEVRSELLNELFYGKPLSIKDSVCGKPQEIKSETKNKN